jgi:hypothetical protein
MIRLFIHVLGKRWALIVCGVALVIAGLIWGASGSHQVSYESSQQNVLYHIAAGTQTGNIYIHANGSSEYFVALSGSFNPPIAQSDIDNSTNIHFVARTDTTSINLDANGTTISDAHPIEKLIFYDKNGNVQTSFITAEYTANPNGFYDNEWLKAIWLIVIGLILGVAALLYPLLRRRPQGNAISHAAAVGAQPSPSYQPYQPYQQPNPYGQAYHGSEQYPQPAPYPPQQTGYGQPGSNPYQQPPYPPQQPGYGQPENIPYQQPPQR